MGSVNTQCVSRVSDCVYHVDGDVRVVLIRHSHCRMHDQKSLSLAAFRIAVPPRVLDVTSHRFTASCFGLVAAPIGAGERLVVPNVAPQDGFDVLHGQSRTYAHLQRWVPCSWAAGGSNRQQGNVADCQRSAILLWILVISLGVPCDIDGPLSLPRPRLSSRTSEREISAS